MKKNKTLINGFVIVASISLLSMGIRQLLLPVIVIEALTIAIIIGMVLSAQVSKYHKAQAGIQYCMKNALVVGIVLLGFSLDFQLIIELGPKIIGLVIGYVIVALFMAYLLGKMLNINSPLAILIGVGSSICGASAVVALSPCIGAEEDDTIIAVSIVSFLGTIGVIIYTFISQTTDINPQIYGIWSGISLHGVSHAVAAAFSLGSQSGEIGTLVKMARVLMIAPVSVVLSYQFGKKGSNHRTVGVPLYIILFLIAGVINSMLDMPIGFSLFIKQLSKLMILFAMAAMGLSIDFSKIKNKGMASVLLGIVIFVIMASTSLVIVNTLFK